MEERSIKPNGSAIAVWTLAAIVAALASIAAWATTAAMRGSGAIFLIAGTAAAAIVGLALAWRLRARIASYGAHVEAAHERDRERSESLVALRENLTDIERYRVFQDDLTRELQRRNRSGAPLSLMLLRITGADREDRGEPDSAGVDRLRLMAPCVFTTLRGADAVHRLAREEFGVILPGESAGGALRLSQRLAETLAAAPGWSPAVFAAGVAEAREPMTRDELIKRAEVALVEGERSGDGSAVVWTAELEQDLRQREQGLLRHHLRAIATALARAVDAKDSYTRNHSETVAEICALIADEMGLPAERAEKLRLAGLLHDVGKIGIPDTILKKPAALTHEEIEVMKSHVMLGYSIVSGADLEEEAEWILLHHERPDGRGYPNGVRGRDLPLEPRIILVADAFEAITSDRPYRPRRSERQAFAELERHAGSHFDAECVVALESALSERPIGELAAARG